MVMGRAGSRRRVVPAVRERHGGPDRDRVRLVGRGCGRQCERVGPADRPADRTRLCHREHRAHRAGRERGGLVRDGHRCEPLPVDDAGFGDRVHGCGRAPQTLIELQTAQCCFNPATVTAYMQKCYLHAAGILSAVGLVPWLQLGEVGWWFFSRLMNEAIGYASWTRADLDRHGGGTRARYRPDGDSRGSSRRDTAANGTWPVVVTDATHFTETGSNGNAAYTAGGTVSGGGMAYYDAYTAAAALAALGRALASFWTQDDDPSINSHADANFLRTQVYAHMHAIAQAVKAAYPGAKIEWLLPTGHQRSGGLLERRLSVPARRPAEQLRQHPVAVHGTERRHRPG